MNLQELHEIIATDLLAKISGLRSIFCYRNGRSPLEAPVGFLEISQIAVGNDPGTGELPIVLTFTLRILIDSTVENSNIGLQSLLIESAQALHSNNFGVSMTPASNIEIQYEEIQDAEGLLVGSVSWSHELHFGISEWISNDWIPPHTIHINTDIMRII
jgi:hypothetical protein